MARMKEWVRSGKGTALTAVALFLAGSGVGAGAMYAARPIRAMGPVAIRPVATLAADGGSLVGERIASVRGRVTEIYGRRFTLTDASGKALVETGRGGRDGLVAVGQTVTVQGRYGDGALHAAYLVGADGAVIALGPPRGPRHGPDGDPPRPRFGPHGGPGTPLSGQTPTHPGDTSPPPPTGKPDAPDAS